MCGILGYFGQQLPSPTRLTKALQSIQHRGPEYCGQFRNARNTLWLGHQLLRIVDQKGGEQPLHNEDGTISLVLNGELYDDAIIRQDLQRKGHHFQTSSDAEILIHLYEEYGLSCLEYLRGEFAFILWDDRQNRLFAGRDRFGIKPLYYSEMANGLALASEMKALLHLGIPFTWDVQTLQHIFTHQYPLGHQSFAENISVLEPGQYLLATPHNVEVHTYWDIQYPTHPEQYSDPSVFLQKLRLALKRRLRADCDFGVYLSGGIDSASILALIAEQGEPPPSFSVSFAVDDYDEAEYASQIANHYGSQHHIVAVTQDDILGHLEDAVWFGESFAINGQLPAKYLLAKYVHQQGIKMVLSGEGADEALLGYPHLKQDLLRYKPQYFPHMHSILEQENQLTKGIFLPRNTNLHSHLPSFLQSKLEFGQTFQQWLHPDALLEFSQENIIQKLFDKYTLPENPVYGATYLWTKMALHSYILRGIRDGMEMSHSIEGRPPFLDHDFFEYACALPLEWKITEGREKYILRQSMMGLLPEWMCQKPKHPFIAPPIGLYATSKGEELIQDILRSESIQKIPYIDVHRLWHFLDQWPSMSLSQRQEIEPPLMLLLSATLFQKRLDNLSAFYD